jgi:hypothetical protein
MRGFIAALVAALTFSAVATAMAESGETQTGKFPDVIDVRVQARGADRFDFDVTVSSPYDSPQRYADAFRVTGAGGVVYGERILWHDHAGEQPFTRDLYGVRIASGVKTVTVQARDRRYGYGGKSRQVTLPGR